MKKFLTLMLSLALTFTLVSCGSNEKQKVSGTNEDVFRVGMECAYAPYNWAQSDDSNGAVPIKDSSDFANGYDVIIAKKIAEDMGKELEIQKIDWDGLPVALQAGTIDAVIAGQSITAERLQTVDFSKPYYYASIVTVVKGDSAYKDAKGIDDFDGATCTSQINTVWYNVCLPQISNANILPAQSTAPEMFVALTSGKVDLVVCDMPTALAATKVYPELKLIDLTESDNNFLVSDEEINIGISVKKGNEELVNKINESLSNMTKDNYEEIMNEAIEIQPLNN